MRSVQAPIIPAVRALILDNPQTISLGQGVVHFPPPVRATERLEAFGANGENHVYGPVAGIPELLAGLARKLEGENGITVGGGNRLLVTAGGNMAFVNAILAVVDSGDEVVLLSPYYFNHEMAVRMAGATPVVVATDADYQPDVEAITAAINRRTRAIVTISPNNPCGAVYPEATLAAINALCRDARVFHIHDEAYEYFTYGEARHVSPASFAGAAAHTISLFSFSKAYGMASWRVGYMVFPKTLAGAIEKIADTVLICSPVVSQHAACGALEAGRAYCRERLVALDAVRRLALDRLATLGPLVSVRCADGAFYLLLEVHRPVEPMALVERLVREHGVAVIPGTAFGLYHGCYLRVSYGALGPDSVAEGIGRLVRGLSTILGG